MTTRFNATTVLQSAEMGAFQEDLMQAGLDVVLRFVTPQLDGQPNHRGWLSPGRRHPAVNTTTSRNICRFAFVGQKTDGGNWP
jgi:hypothetical protein